MTSCENQELCGVNSRSNVIFFVTGRGTIDIGCPHIFHGHACRFILQLLWCLSLAIIRSWGKWCELYRPLESEHIMGYRKAGLYIVVCKIIDNWLMHLSAGQYRKRRSSSEQNYDLLVLKHWGWPLNWSFKNIWPCPTRLVIMNMFKNASEPEALCYIDCQVQWNLDITNLYQTKSSVKRTSFFTPVMVKYMKKNFDITNLHVHNEVLGKTNEFLCPSNGQIYEKEPRIANTYCQSLGPSLYRGSFSYILLLLG